MTGPYRHPAEESEGLYPRLIVHVVEQLRRCGAVLEDGAGG